jgi:hypothetical protein
MTAATPVLELDEVRKVYPGTPPVEPVRGVTLTVTQGSWWRWWARPGRARPRCCT